MSDGTDVKCRQLDNKLFSRFYLQQKTVEFQQNDPDVTATFFCPYLGNVSSRVIILSLSLYLSLLAVLQ